MYRRTAAIIVFTSILFIASRTSTENPPSWGIHSSYIEEFQPSVAPGGRANTIAVHPVKNKIILVASESGGLFRSTDGGTKWQHIETLLPFYTNAVAFIPSDPKIVIATTSEDFSSSNRGGIWRSENGGDTWDPVIWKHPSTNNFIFSPSPPGIPNRFSAFEISIAPDTGNIYVASTNGLEIGEPDGKHWKHQDLSVPLPQLMSVLALPKKTQGGNNVILAGGASGFYRSANGGKSWSAPKNPPPCNTTTYFYPQGCVVDMHAFGNSPVAKNHAYVINALKQLYYSEDSGDTWMEIKGTSVGGQWCGGICFIQVQPSTQSGSIELYFGNRCTISRLTAPPVTGTSTFNYSGTFTELQTDHGDTRHVAFNKNHQPILLATDGGLHKTTDGGAGWTFTGGGNNGYNALQIYETKGQWIDDTAVHNLYFGTQDNSLWSSGDDGKTWSYCCNEGGYFEFADHVPTATESQITFFTPWENKKLKGLLFSTGTVELWPNPSATDDSYAGRPKFVKKNFHVEGVESDFPRGLAVTYDGFAQSTSWKKLATIDDDRRDIPELSLTSQQDPTLYQAIRTGDDPVTGLETHGLARIKKDGSVWYPAMKNFGGFGIAPTMDAWYHVFAVDPGNVDHLIAADVIKKKMMETFDGGAEWKEMQQLTSLVTNGGKLNFRGRVFFSQTPPLWFPDLLTITQVSAISFCPDNPKMIAVGTVQNGVFLSSGGKTWKKVPGSERATLISSIHWRQPDDLIVSTYGRGLWRIRFKYVTPVMTIPPCKSPDCYHIYLQPPPREQPSPYDQIVLAFAGQIQGVRVAVGMVQEIFVRPGTTIAFGVDSRQLPDIKVTETLRPVGFLGLQSAPEAPRQAQVITGLTLKNGKLVGVQFSPKSQSMFVPNPERATEPAGSRESPTRNKPYLEVLSGPVSNPGSTMQLHGRGFTAGEEFEIAVDRKSIARVTADHKGEFATTVRAPAEFGFHIISILRNRRIIDGSIFSVRPIDR